MCLVALAAMTADASFVDPTFQSGSGANGGFVESMALQPDGKIVICGSFTSFAAQPRAYVARLNSDGSVDTSFAADVGYWVRFVARQTDGKFVIGGFFTGVGAEPRNRIARLNVNGSLDTGFTVGTGCEGKIVPADPTDPFIFAIAIQTDGKILIGGNFTTYNGTPRSGLARLNTDGSLDTSFNIGSGANSWVRSLLIQTNGQILVSGWFTDFAGQSHNRMVRLNSDGTPDSSFNPYFGDQTAIYTMAQLANGKYVVAGHSINTNAPFRQEIVRLNSDGTYDTSFNSGGSGANEKIESLVVQPDGKIVMVGYFNQYNGTPIGNVARLNPDGSLDSSFGANADNWLWTVLEQTDHKLLICGGCSSVDGISCGGIARLSAATTLHAINPRRIGNTFSVSVQTEAGKNYALQFKNSLTNSWSSLPSVAGDGTVKTLSDSGATTTARFYQILQN